MIESTPAFSTEELQNLYHDFQKPVMEAGAFIRSQVGRVSVDHIEVKSQNSLVSYVDKKAEEILVSGLSDLLPGCGFITEEDTIANHKRALTWIVDPLDGTTNFLQNIPMFAVSVALYKGTEPLLGAILDIAHNELFTAIKDGGAFLNGNPIRVSATHRLEDAIVATGFPYEAHDKVNDPMQWFTRFLEHSRGLRRLGSAALDLAYVACGRFDGFYEASLNAWDVAAGVLIVREAGGTVTDFHGGERFLHHGMIVASNGYVHTEMMPLLH